MCTRVLGIPGALVHFWNTSGAFGSVAAARLMVDWVGIEAYMAAGAAYDVSMLGRQFLV